MLAPHVIHCLFAIAIALAVSERSFAQDSEEFSRPLECLVSCGSQPIADAEVHVVFSVPSRDMDDVGVTKTRRQSTRVERQIIEETTYRTDSLGKYKLIPPDLELPGLTASIAIRHAEYLPRAFYNQPVVDLIRYPRSTVRRVRLRKAHQLKGRVLLPNGKPAVGAKVTAASKYRPYSWKFFDPNDYSATLTVKTDGDGNFAVATDERATVEIGLPGFATLLVDQYLANTPRNETTFRLPGAKTVRGRVTDLRNKPVPFAIVTATRKHVHNEANMPMRFAKSTVTDELGQFEIILPKESYILRVAARLKDKSAAKQWLANQNALPELGDGISFEVRETVETISLSGKYLDKAIDLVSPEQVVDFAPQIEARPR